MFIKYLKSLFNKDSTISVGDYVMFGNDQFAGFGCVTEVIVNYPNVRHYRVSTSASTDSKLIFALDIIKTYKKRPDNLVSQFVSIGYAAIFYVGNTVEAGTVVGIYTSNSSIHNTTYLHTGQLSNGDVVYEIRKSKTNILMDVNITDIVNTLPPLPRTLNKMVNAIERMAIL